MHTERVYKPLTLIGHARPHHHDLEKIWTTQMKTTNKQAPMHVTQTSKVEVADLIVALCEAGEWDLAVRMARDADRESSG